MKTGKLKNYDFEWQVEENIINDMRFLELLIDVEKGNPLAIIKLVTRLFGEEQKEALYDVIENEEGRVDVELFGEIVSEIILAIGESGKNS